MPRAIALLCLLATLPACAEEPPSCWTWTQRTVGGAQLVCLRAPPGVYVVDGWHVVAEICLPDADALRAKAAERHLRICEG